MVGYKRLMETRPMPQHNAFAWFYLGGVFGGGGGVVAVGERAKLPETTLQWSILVFLGVVLASGIESCYVGVMALPEVTPGR